MDNKEYKKLVRTLAIIALNLGILIGISDLRKDDSENDTQKRIHIPDGYEYTEIDGRPALVKHNEYHENKDINIPEGYTAEVYYYGYKKIYKTRNGKTYEDYIYIEAEEYVLDNGNVVHVVPSDFTLGIKYRLIPLEEIIYLDESREEKALKLAKKYN